MIALENIKGKSFFCSWSGGKDSCFAFFQAKQAGGIPKYILTMMDETGAHSRSHGLPLSVFREQSRSIGVELETCAVSWDTYEENFIHTLRKFKSSGVEVGVFGDIDIEGHREWVERVCQTAGIEACEPLWRQSRRDLLQEFLKQGFSAKIVAGKDGSVDKNLLGKHLDAETIGEFEKSGIDLCGENGEYHTAVTGGPVFTSRICFPECTGKEMHDGYWFLRYE